MELRKFTGTTNDLKAEIARLQKNVSFFTWALFRTITVRFMQVEKLEGQLDFKDGELARVAQKHASEIARLAEDLRMLRESYEIKIKEYEELMDVKVQLDQEIATYRALLQEEENRYLHWYLHYCTL